MAYVNHNIGTAWHFIGKERRDHNDILKAVQYHERGKQIREENDFDERARDLTASYTWLGNDLIQLAAIERDHGDADGFGEHMRQAKDCIERSLEGRKKILGDRHQDVAWPLLDLSNWYEIMGDISSAIAETENVIEIRQRTLGKEHRYTEKAVERKEQLLKKLR